MQTVQIDKANALKAHAAGNKDQKALLETLLGKEIFTPQNITDRIQSLEDVFSLIPPTDNMKILLDYNGIDPKVLGAKNFMLAEMITEAYNEGWEADYSNDNQVKYEVIYQHKPGFGLSGALFDSWYSDSHCGSRLCWKDPAHAVDAHKKFADVFKTVVNK